MRQRLYRAVSYVPWVLAVVFLIALAPVLWLIDRQTGR